MQCRRGFTASALPDGRQVSEIRLEHIPENVKDAVITVEWNFPILDIAGRWHNEVCDRYFDRSA